MNKRYSVKTPSIKAPSIKALWISLLITALVACGGDDNADASVATDVIDAKKVYIRALPPGQTVSALFMSLVNSSTDSHALLKVNSKVSRLAELHEHTHENGLMKMGQVERIVIPAKGSVELAPGGYHIMLIDLQQHLKAGDKVMLELVFEDDSAKTIQADVKTINPH